MLDLWWLQFLKTVYLKTSNVRFGSFFQNPVTNYNLIIDLNTSSELESLAKLGKSFQSEIQCCWKTMRTDMRSLMLAMIGG